MFSGLKHLFNNFIFGNVFIALCAMGMVFTTFLMNGLPIQITADTVFITTATYLLYNFHSYSFRLNFYGLKEFKFSADKLLIRPMEKLLHVTATILLIISFFFLSSHTYAVLFPLVILAISYSVPIIRWKNKKIRLTQIPMLKTPAIALVWGVITTIIPLVEQNITIFSAFVILQAISRSLFVFALCIPFEIRDVESDAKKNVNTLPVVFGVNNTKMAGSIIVIVEIIMHHLMKELTSNAIVALDLSSLIALLWIIQEGKKTGVYYYKFVVDGTMLVRFIFLFFSIHKL
jgi:4-hydroxybenzoate polyprenyltransferase